MLKYLIETKKREQYNFFKTILLIEVFIQTKKNLKKIKKIKKNLKNIKK